MKLALVTLTVKDMEESLKFYTEVLGLKPQDRRAVGPNMELAFLGDGETMVELICNQEVSGCDMGSNISLGFEINSVDKKIAELKEKGIAVHSGPFQPAPQVKFFFIMDPNGLKIQLLEHLN